MSQQINNGQRPDNGRIWGLTNPRLREGLWLVTDTALMRGVRKDSGFRFAAMHTVPGILRTVFSPTGLDQHIRFFGHAQVWPDKLTDKLRRVSLYQIACAVRDEIDAGISRETPRGPQIPVSTALCRDTVPFERSIKNEVRAAVAAKLQLVLREQIGAGFALAVIDGAVHRVPTPKPRLVVRPLRPRPRPEPVSVAEKDIRSVGLDLDGLLHRLDVVSEPVIRYWRRRTDFRTGRQIEAVKAYLARADTERDWNASGTTDVYRRGHYQVVLTEDYVIVEKQNQQPWYIKAPNGHYYRFPGTHLEIRITALGEIPGVTVLQPKVHRFMQKPGFICLQGSRQFIDRLLKNYTLRVSEAVERIFAFYEHSIRATSVLDGITDPSVFARFGSYRVPKDAQLPSGAVFYSNRVGLVTR